MRKTPPEKGTDTPLSDTDKQLKILDLIKMKRSPEDDLKVQRILVSRADAGRKIKEIEEIDSPSMKGVDPPKSDSSSDDELFNFPVKPDNREFIRQNTRTMQKSLGRNPMFRYWLFDYWRIGAFGKSTRIVRPGFIPPRVTYTSEISSIMESIRDEASKILPMVYFAAEVGWLHLVKFDYNLLVKLKNLCEAIINTECVSVWKVVPGERFFEVKKAFLECHYEETFPKLIVNAFTGVLNQYVKTKPRAQALGELTFRMLTDRSENHNIYNVVLGTAMVQYRKFLRLRDLINPVEGGIIGDYDFDCDESTRTKIEAHIYMLTKKIEGLLDEKRKIERINYFIAQFAPLLAADNTKYDFRQMVEFYETGSGVDKFQFIRDNNEIAIFVINFFKRFFAEFENLLTGAVEVEGEGVIRLFNFEFANLELSRLKSIVLALNKMIFSSPTLSRKRFIQLKDKNQPESPSAEEAYVIHVVDEINKVMIGLGEKIGNICLNHSKEPTPGEEHRIIKMIDQSVFIGNKYEIYFWDRMILVMGYLRGRSFGSALSALAAVCFLFPLYFMDTHLYSNLEKEREIKDKLRTAKTELEHAMNPAAFQALVNKYRLK
ncbi:MAG: hypothetical protein A2Y33_12360 [Spirochaetes bacterium GWF1_51_8]|nr:MAG: hypothetical protein A2Y33_12360 [Spirochaetes bacterium GWF1_51_8]